MRCFYHPDYVFPLPEAHPFPMDKFWRAAAILCEHSGNGVVIESVEPAPLAALLRVHTASYLERIRTGTLDPAATLKLGLPASEALFERSRLEVGGTLAAMNAALEDGIACNLAGGTHHAFADRGEGYCVLNDVAIAIRARHESEPGARIIVIDTDAHQGNGTHALFADDARVFTYSIHVAKNYPSIKVPGSLDIGLPRYVEGDDYLEQLEATLDPAVDDFQPHFAFWIAGADLHTDDRFGQMRLRDSHLAARDRHVLDIVTSRHVPVAVLYGGGYNRTREHTARLHANTVLTAAEFAPRARRI